MPTRYIKESARTSKNLCAVSDFAERLFWRLITTADDFGRFMACSLIVKSACFPLLDTLNPAKVERALTELEAHTLIQLYHAGDRRYGWFLQWAKHQGEPRAKHSKYPDPTLSASAGNCLHLPTNAHGAPDTDTDLSSPNLKSTKQTDDFEQFWRAYPKKRGKDAARAMWNSAKHRPPLAQILAVLTDARASHDWTREHGKYIPHPTRWIKEGRWRDEHTDNGPVTSLTCASHPTWKFADLKAKETHDTLYHPKHVG